MKGMGPVFSSSLLSKTRKARASSSSSGLAVPSQLLGGEWYPREKILRPLTSPVSQSGQNQPSSASRYTGKTDVRNIEPEDLRAITLASDRDFGVPLAGAKRNTVVAAAE